MLVDIVILFLAISIVFYFLFGGADFGAGVLEYFTGRTHRQTIAHAIGPVWEANHVWLILVVVILFMGFPRLYSTLSTYLHIPLVLLLLGIILRGTAFTYMHYDAIEDRSTRLYNSLFRVSSVLTPLFLGIVVGAAILGRIDPEAETFYAGFIRPWFNGFSFSVGLFTIGLFTLLAAIFMIGETDDLEEKEVFTRAAGRVQILTVFFGIMVFGSGYAYGLPMLQMFFNSWIAITCVILATLSLPLLWYFLKRGDVLLTRLLAGLQILLVLGAWFWIQAPVVIRIQSGVNLTFNNTVAPEATILQLVLALIVGSCIILPSLYFLMKTFKGEQFSQRSDSRR